MEFGVRSKRRCRPLYENLSTTPISGSYTPRPATGSTYRPAYVPPTPVQAPVKKEVIKVDTSKIKAGAVVTHKAFGAGQVKGVDGALIVVAFKGVEKKFQFPGAFEQGFLKLDE